MSEPTDIAVFRSMAILQDAPEFYIACDVRVSRLSAPRTSMSTLLVPDARYGGRMSWVGLSDLEALAVLYSKRMFSPQNSQLGRGGIWDPSPITDRYLGSFTGGAGTALAARLRHGGLAFDEADRRNREHFGLHEGWGVYHRFELEPLIAAWLRAHGVL